jgi:nicotinamidase-related amidase
MLSLDAKKTALVIIDLQHGIVRMPALAPHTVADVIARTVRIAERVKARGGAIIPVNVRFSPDGADRLSQPVDQAMPVSAGMPADWSDLVPEIAALPADVRVTKRQWSAFYGTDLDLQLRRRHIDTIILTGIATGFGVEGTGRDAWQMNYSVVFAEDAMSAPGVDLHTFAVQKIFPRLGRTRSTDEIVAAL